MRLLLTDLTIKALKPTADQVDYYCTKQRGFGVRVSPAGTKTFFVITTTPRRRVSLGKYPDLSLAEARRSAKTTTGPQDIPSITFSDAFATYLASQIIPNYRPRPAAEVERLIRKHAHTLMARKLATVTIHDVTGILDSLASTPSEANHFFKVLRTFYAWTLEREYISVSPIQRLSKPAKEVARDRLLTNDELKAIWDATADAGTFNAIVRFCILTGQRRGEVAQIKSSWVSNDALTFPKEVTKNGVEHTIYLTENARALISRIADTNYNSWSQPKARLDAHSGVTGWVLHDFRRFFSSTHAAIDTPILTCELLLNHRTALSPIARIYNRHTYFPQFKAALLAYERHLSRFCEGLNIAEHG